MTADLTPATEAIRARADAATPGPWQVYDAHDGDGSAPLWSVSNDAYHSPIDGGIWDGFNAYVECGSREDAEFIANARQDVPALIAEVWRLMGHSTWLNTISFNNAVALGRVADGQDVIEGNPLEQAAAVIAALDEARGQVAQLTAERDAMRQALDALATHAYSHRDELTDLLDNHAVRLATGETCVLGMSMTCADAHSAGHCVKPRDEASGTTAGGDDRG